MNYLIPLFLALFLCFASTARAIQGRLLTPTSGTTYHWPNQLIHVQYERVVTPEVQTLDITVTMDALNDTYFGLPLPLLGGIQSCNAGQDAIIDASNLVPPDFFGDYYLHVFEHQLTPTGQKSFLAASPIIHITGSPGQGPSHEIPITDWTSPSPGSTIVDKGPGIGHVHVYYTAEVPYAGPLGIDVQVEAIYPEEGFWTFSIGLAGTPCGPPSTYNSHVFDAYFSPPNATASCGNTSLALNLHGQDAGPYGSASRYVTLECET